MNLSLSVSFLLILSLNNSNSLIQTGQKMWKFWVYFIDQIWEICAGFIIDSLEKHDRSEILFEILKLIMRNLSLQNVNDTLFFSWLDFLCESNYLIFESDDTIYISSQSMHLIRVNIDDLLTNQLNLVVRTSCDIINKVSNRNFSTFWYNIFDVFAFDEPRGFDCFHNSLLPFRLEKSVFVLLTGLLEEHHSIISNKVIDESPLSVLE